MNNIKTISFAVLFLVILGILYFFYGYRPSEELVRAKLENEFQNDMTLKKYILEEGIHRVIEGARSLSSRSVIRDKIIAYKNGEVSFEELSKFTLPKYLEGARVLDSCIYAARYVDNRLLVEFPDVAFKRFGLPVLPDSMDVACPQVQIKDSTIIIAFKSPVMRSDSVLGYDIVISSCVGILRKLANKSLVIEFLKSDHGNGHLGYGQDTIVYHDENIKFITRSELSNMAYRFSVPKEFIDSELYIFRKRQLTVVFLFSVSLLLLLITVHQSSKLYYFRKGKYLEELVAHKTSSLNEAISQLEKANVSLKENERLLKESNQTKDKFFSVIAHDLKSPFNALLGFSELLVRDGNRISDAKRNEYIGLLYKVLKSTNEMLENLLAWGRSQTGTLRLHKRKVNLYRACQEIIIASEPSASLKGICLINNLKKEIDVYADGMMLNSIIRNLVINSIKYTNEGGKVEISALLRDGMAEISVSDTGIGMDAITTESLFKVSEIKSLPGTKDEKGNALGLLLCRDFVEKHSGRIWVESIPGKGSVFTFTLPINKGNNN